MHKLPWNRWLGWTVVAVVLADWSSKFLVQNHLSVYERIAVLDGWLYLIHLQNRGVAFSILNDSTAVWRTPLLVVAASVAVIALARLARTLSDTRGRFAIAFIMGGALGNLGDRIASGGVTDFISVSFFPYVFNVADAAICVGAALLAWRLTNAQKALP